MNLENCYFVVKNRKSKEETLKGLEVLMEAIGNIPLNLGNAPFLYVEGESSYIKITPNLPIEIKEFCIVGQEDPVITTFFYKEGYFSFKYNGVSVELHLKNKEKELQEEVERLRKK